MSETPEETIQDALELHEMSSAPGTQAHADAVAALSAIASLRQRQEALEQQLEATPTAFKSQSGLLDAVERLNATIESLRTQLQQAETALRAIADCHKTFESGAADIRGQHCLDLERIARAALAAPPPNTTGRPPECGGGAFAADSTESTDPAPPPNTPKEA